VRGIASAPGRVNLIGEHTDYSNGFALPFAITARTQVSADSRVDDLLRISSAQRPDASVELTVRTLRPGQPAGWAAYVAGVVWALRNQGIDIEGFDIAVDSAVPLGAGLSSSAALTCATALALTAAAGATLSPTEIAVVARRAENDYVGVPCGLMDQIAVMTARAGHALFPDFRSSAVE